MGPLLRFLGLTHLISGLNSEYQGLLHKEISVLVKHGNFTWHDLMVMPTYSRRIFLHELTTKNEKE